MDGRVGSVGSVVEDENSTENKSGCTFCRDDALKPMAVLLDVKDDEI